VQVRFDFAEPGTVDYRPLAALLCALSAFGIAHHLKVPTWPIQFIQGRFGQSNNPVGGNYELPQLLLFQNLLANK
jgi:hypothetical protein